MSLYGFEYPGGAVVGVCCDAYPPGTKPLLAPDDRGCRECGQSLRDITPVTSIWDEIAALSEGERIAAPSDKRGSE